MFHRKIFGRKQVSAPAETPVFSGHSAPSSLTVDSLLDALEAMLKIEPYGANSFIDKQVEGLSPNGRAALLASFEAHLPEMQADVSYHNQTARQRFRDTILSYVIRKDIDPDAEHLRPLAALLCGAPEFNRRYLHRHAHRMIKFLKAAVAKGGHLTASDCAMLDDYAERIRAASEKYERADAKHWGAIADSVGLLTGNVPTATSILLERCEPADSPHAFGALPEHFDFWAGVLASIATGMGRIAEDVRGKSQAPWMKSQAEFDRLFPGVGPIQPRFQQWAGDLGPQHRPNFEFLRERLKQKRKVAPPETYLSARADYARYDTMIRYQWNGSAIPLIERLGDLEAEGGTALLEQLVVAKNGPRPPARWLKTSLAVAEAQGLEATQQRLQHWLELFHTPCPSPKTVGEAWNCEVIAHAAARLTDAYPDWPQTIAPDQVPALGASIAMDLVSGNRSGFPCSVGLFLIDHSRDHAFLEVSSITSSERRVRYNGYAHESLAVSVQNDQVLRGAIWLLPHMPDKAAAIEALEKCVLAGISLKAGRNRSYRSESATNAAVASLATMGTPDAMLALTRLASCIEDGGVQNNIRAILTA